ncbi:hypothetical protein Q8A73_009980 [Channa argus]|nr:hypothetical protein Q8A73_009980 [Channa argus]
MKSRRRKGRVLVPSLGLSPTLPASEQKHTNVTELLNGSFLRQLDLDLYLGVYAGSEATSVTFGFLGSLLFFKVLVSLGETLHTMFNAVLQNPLHFFISNQLVWDARVLGAKWRKYCREDDDIEVCKLNVEMEPCVCAQGAGGGRLPQADGPFMQVQGTAICHTPCSSWTPLFHFFKSDWGPCSPNIST